MNRNKFSLSQTTTTLLVIVVAISSNAFAVSPLPPSAALPNQRGLAHLFYASRITGQNPMQSMACFADYIAESNLISEKYGSGYNDCLNQFTQSRKIADSNALNERKEIVIIAEGICGRMNTCNQVESTLDMFNCHANLGSNNTKATYTISGNASEYATTLQENYRLIDLRHEQCCHAAERAYVENTAQNYNHLQACLDGRVQPRPPKQTTTTTAAPTTTTTTTTTEPPTTTIATDLPTDSPQRIQEQFAQLLNLLN